MTETCTAGPRGDSTKVSRTSALGKCSPSRSRFQPKPRAGTPDKKEQENRKKKVLVNENHHEAGRRERPRIRRYAFYLTHQQSFRSGGQSRIESEWKLSNGQLVKRLSALPAVVARAVSDGIFVESRCSGTEHENGRIGPSGI